jgi:hypothetical protein
MNLGGPESQSLNSTIQTRDRAYVGAGRCNLLRALDIGICLAKVKLI